MQAKPWLLIVAMIGIISCKKDPEKEPEPQPANNTLSGTWKGLYNHRVIVAPGDTTFPEKTQKITFIFRADSTMTVFDGDVNALLEATGRYHLEGSTFYGSYHYIKGASGAFSLKATLQNGNLIDGKWMIGYWGQTGGTFYIKK